MLLLHDREGRVLLVRRPPTGVWSGMWSLPEVADHDQAREFVAAHSERTSSEHPAAADRAHLQPLPPAHRAAVLARGRARRAHRR
jgi:A/G-specific adenine glycosylase